MIDWCAALHNFRQALPPLQLPVVGHGWFHCPEGILASGTQPIVNSPISSHSYSLANPKHTLQPTKQPRSKKFFAVTRFILRARNAMATQKKKKHQENFTPELPPAFAGEREEKREKTSIVVTSPYVLGSNRVLWHEERILAVLQIWAIHCPKSRFNHRALPPVTTTTSQ